MQLISIFCSQEINGAKIRQTYIRAEAFQIYRSLQILNNEFNSYHSTVIIPTFLYALLGLTTIITITTLKIHDSITVSHLLLYFVYLITAVAGIAITFPLAGNSFHTSISFIQFWGFQCENLHHRLFLKSCFPLQIKVGLFGCFKKSTTFAAFGFITYCSMRAAITL